MALWRAHMKHRAVHVKRTSGKRLMTMATGFLRQCCQATVLGYRRRNWLTSIKTVSYVFIHGLSYNTKNAFKSKAKYSVQSLGRKKHIPEMWGEKKVHGKYKWKLRYGYNSILMAVCSAITQSVTDAFPPLGQKLRSASLKPTLYTPLWNNVTQPHHKEKLSEN